MERKWLFLSVLSLSLSGLFSFFVVFLRLPFFVKFIPNIFDVSLVIHVNLAVNFWMLTIAIFLWSSFVGQSSKFIFNFSYILCIIAMFFIFFAGFVPKTTVIKSNYVPFMDNFLFALGIALFFCGVFLAAVSTIASLKLLTYKNFPVFSSAVIFVIALFCAVLSLAKMPSGIGLNSFYEYLFWGFGHTLQFLFCQVMIVVYFILVGKPANDRILRLVSVFNTIAVLPLPFVYIFFDVQDELFADIFSYHMRILLGIGPIAAILYLIINLEKLVNVHAFLLSASLFLYGGLIGFLIKGADVIIPAHYHGSIVGITIAFIALIYYVSDALNKKAEKFQLWTYTIGQFMHITGLLLMGGYGALRKTAGMVSSTLPIYKSIFMIGGTITILSGGLFIFFSIKGLLNCKRPNNSITFSKLVLLQ